MLFALALLMLMVTFWALTFYRFRLKVSTGIVVAEFAFLYLITEISATTLLALTLILAPPLLLINIPWLRAHLISKILLRRVKSQLPPMSKTEAEAIASGSTWWERELFCGRPNWNKLHNFGQPVLLADGRDFLANQVTTLCTMLNDWKITHHQHDLPKEVWQYLKAEKFFGMTIPKRYGGLGFSAYAHSCVITMIASRSYSAAVTVMVPNSLGPAELLQHFGTEVQREYYLPRLAIGQEIPCFALTSPTAGSDATSITDTGIICKGLYEGKECLGLRLNWNKRYITLAPVATIVCVAVHVYDPERLLGGECDLGITTVLVPAHLPGVERGQRHLPLHQAFMNGPIKGKDVFVSLEQVIGGEANLGKGWQMMTDSLAVGRGISLPAVSTATAKFCYRVTGAYARVREQFNMPIGKFEGIAVALARIGAATYLCEAARLFTTGAIDSGAKPSIASAITKYHLTEMSRQIINDAMDIHAGRGIIMGEHNYLANLYTANPIGITVEGANVLTRNLIIFGQGAYRCHPYLAKELEAVTAKNDKKALLRFDRLIFKHIGFVISNFTRTLSYGLSCSKTIHVPEEGALKYYYQEITRMSTAFALTVDVAFIVIGGDLKRRENLSARLGDVLSHLYLASAVFKYFRDCHQPKEDLPFIEYSLTLCLFKIQTALENFMDNMPQSLLTNLLKLAVFPWGKPYKLPADSLAQQIATAMMTPSSQRDRLTEYCYLSYDDEDATCIMEQALNVSVRSEKAYTKLKAALKASVIDSEQSKPEQVAQAVQLSILTLEEGELLNTFYRLQNQAIQVDAYEGILV